MYNIQSYLKVSVGVEEFLLEYTNLNIIVWHISCWRTWEMSEVWFLRLKFLLFHALFVWEIIQYMLYILYCSVSAPFFNLKRSYLLQKSKKKKKSMSHVTLLKEKSICAVLQSNHKGFSLLRNGTNASIFVTSSFLPPILSCLWMCMLQGKCWFLIKFCDSFMDRILFS